MTFVIHGATGAQGAPVLARLAKAGRRAVAAVRHVGTVKDAPSVAVDNESVDSLVEAYRDAEGVFVHLTVTAEPERLRHARNIARAIGIAKPLRVVISTSGWVVDEPGSPLQYPPESAIATLIRETEATGVSMAVAAPRLFLENLLNPLVLEPVRKEGVLRYPLRANYRVSWSSHQDVAQVVERLLTDRAVTGLVGVGHTPGLTGLDLASGFARVLSRPVSFESLTPRAFGEMIAPMFGEGAAAGVVAGYEAQARAAANAIAPPSSAQSLLGLQPRSVEQWLGDVLA
jgi:uncharacterized protein YbjT (DUF2867 family)